MHERPVKRVLIVATAACLALVIGCAGWILHAPAIPHAPNRYIAANFVYEQSRMPASGEGASTPSDAPESASPSVDQSRIASQPAPDVGTPKAARPDTEGETGSAPASETALLDVVGSAAAAPMARQSGKAVRILQIGDSHTAADYFSGALRRRLQARFGIGGPGYLAAGKPHLGVRSDIAKVTTSSGWTYQAIQRSEDVSQFWLSGFNAVSAAPGNTITYTSDTPMSFDSIEVEAVRQPHGGTFEVRLDGALEGTFDLGGAAVEPIVFRLRPKAKPVEKFHQLEIRTTGDGPVVISSVGIYNSRGGVSLSSVGFPGATVSLLNKFAGNLFADDLRRIDPQIVILAFGTNEASNDKLNAASYRATYEGVIDKIKAALPAVSIVVVGPPDGEERGPGCKGSTVAVCRPSNASRPPESAAAPPSVPDCAWHQLPKLTEVRNAQQEIAARRGLPYWNWASIMPEDCAAHRWVTAMPPLMTPDHIHFTHDGYAKSAEQLLPVVAPLVEKFRGTGNAAANDVH